MLKVLLSGDNEKRIWNYKINNGVTAVVYISCSVMRIVKPTVRLHSWFSTPVLRMKQRQDLYINFNDI
jgi:hypothetical protein